MEIKKCSKCLIEKNIIEFYKENINSSKHRSLCKQCNNENSKKYRENNKEKINKTKLKNKNKYKIKAKESYNKNKENILLNAKKYRNKNKEKIKKYIAIYRDVNKDKIKITVTAYGIKNRIKIKEQTAKFREENRSIVNEMARKSYKKHAEKCAERSKIYRANNKERLQKKNSEYIKNKYKTDPFFKLKKTLRGRCLEAFKCVGKKKNTKSEILIGGSFEIARAHIERQFTKGMSWDNHGEWEIDHLIPISSAKTEEDIASLCHYTNLQPLWKIDNAKKKAKILPIQTKLIM